MMDAPTRERFETLAAFRQADAARPVSDAAVAAAQAAAERFGDSARAVIFYGSCLRDGTAEEGLFDFYVIVDSYRRAYGRTAPATANAALPPNVFYMETPFGESGPLRAKVAVLSMRHLQRLAGPKTFNPTLWARLAQPVRVPVAADGAARAEVGEALAASLRAMAAAVVPVLPGDFTSDRFWRTAFSLTYGAELRAEGTDRGGDIYETEAAFFDAALARLAAEPQVPLVQEAGTDRYRRDTRADSRRRGALAWRARQVQGKTLTVLRLVKAGFTFEGGADYLAWKIARHSGVTVTLTPWQRRHPVLTGLLMFGRLWRRRAFR